MILCRKSIILLILEIIKLEGDIMKKAISYVLIGMAAGAFVTMWLDNNCDVNCKMRKIKEAGQEAVEKMKAVL